MPAFAPSLPRPDALLTPVAPGAAYAADVGRLNGRAPVSPADDAWLVLAQAVASAAALPPGQRASLLVAGADQVEALLPIDAPVRAALAAAAEGLRTLAGRLTRGVTRTPGAGDGEALRIAVSALQVVVAQQEQAGVFLLAFGTLATLRTALAPVLDARSEGLFLAQQGRVARQLGAMTTAAELYAAAVRAGRTARAPDVAARALIGGGVLASMRGNYPEARDLFRRGLAAAERAGAEDHVRASHQGLLMAALAAQDVETALAHGWAAFRETPPDATDTRAEMLATLGDVSRQSGEYRAALGACLSALEMTDTVRVRLPALGTAALSAACLGEHRLFTFIASDAERTIARSGQPFENARTLVEIAEAAMVLGLAETESFADRAELLAVAGCFHEVVARVEVVRTNILRASQQRDTRPAIKGSRWSAKTRTVLRSLESLVMTGSYAAQGTL